MNPKISRRICFSVVVFFILGIFGFAAGNIEGVSSLLADTGGSSIAGKTELLSATTATPTPTQAPAPSRLGQQVTSLQLTSATAQTLAPFCFGQAFKEGDIPSGSSVIANLSNFQATIKSRWPDGSAQFAILCGRASAAANTPLTVSLAAGTPSSGTRLTETDLSRTGANALVTFQGVGSVELSTLIGRTGRYQSGINQWSAGKFLDWIEGPEMSSWIYYSPIGTDPHLAAWFEVRLWKGGAVEILPWIENGYLLKPGAAQKNGMVSVSVGKNQVFSQDLSVLHHTRTPLVSGSTFSYWLGANSRMTPKHDTDYLQRSKLVPNYGAVIPKSSSIWSTLTATFTPFAQANYPGTIGTAGYHGSIGLLPEWDVLYLTSGGDARAFTAITVNAYAAGRYGIHYRDEKTNRPIRFSSYPNLVLNGSSGISGTGASSTNTETPAGAGGIAPSWATSHAPSVGYMAYLLYGRFYFMEECQFAAGVMFLKQTDTNRQFTKGILRSDAGANTTRGVAWGLRTYLHAALATPDSDPLKSEFLSAISENINYYHAQYVARPNNPQGIVSPYSSYSGGNNVYKHAIWMEDFLTAAFGYILDTKTYAGVVGTKAKEFFDWKARSIVGRLGAPNSSTEYDFRDAAQYTMAVAPSRTADWKNGTGPWYANWRGNYQDTLGSAAGTAATNQLRGGNFPEASSYWGNIQPAIAYAVTNGVSGARAAYGRMTGASNWSTFSNNLNHTPVWSIVPSGGISLTSAPIPTSPPTPTSTPTPTPTPTATPAPSGSLPTWVSNLPLWQWHEIPNTKLSDTPPSVKTFGYPKNKFDAWCGAALKPRGSIYLVGACGGHSDYAGNEMNALALNVEKPRWVELRGPTPPADIYDGVPFYKDMRPAPAHTYLNAHYIESMNSYVIFTRSGINFNAGGVPKPPVDWPYPHTDAYSKVFNLDKNDWELAPTPSIAKLPASISTDVALSYMHPVTGDFYMSPSHSGGYWKWTRATNSWAKTGGGNRSPWYAGADVDPTRNRILVFGGYAPTDPFVSNLGGTQNIPVTWGGLGKEVLRNAAVMQYPGVVYDKHGDRFLLFYGHGNEMRLYAVNAATFEVTEPVVTGTKPASRKNGIHNSVQYVPELRGIVVANKYDGNVFFMRTSR